MEWLIREIFIEITDITWVFLEKYTTVTLGHLGLKARARTTRGLNGGCTSLDSIFAQSMRRKNGWSRISLSPLGPLPRRLAGFFWSSWKIANVHMPGLASQGPTYSFAYGNWLFTERFRIRNVMLSDRREQLVFVFSIEWRLASEHLEQQDPICPPVDGFPVWLVKNDLKPWILREPADIYG